MQNEDRFNRAVHDLVNSTPVKQSVNNIVVMFYQAEDIRFVFFDKVHDTIKRAAILQIIKL